MAAYTFKKDQLGVTARNSDHLSPVAEVFPEGATQTFLAGALVKLTAGYITVAAVVNTAPAAGALFGIALEDAHNDAAAGTHDITVVRLEANHELYANLLGAAAADHTVAATDLGLEVDLLWATNYLGTGISGWFATVGGGASGEVVSLRGDQVPSAGRLPTNEAQVGDINARVRVRIKPAILSQA